MSTGKQQEEMADIYHEALTLMDEQMWNINDIALILGHSIGLLSDEGGHFIVIKGDKGVKFVYRFNIKQEEL